MAYNRSNNHLFNRKFFAQRMITSFTNDNDHLSKEDIESLKQLIFTAMQVEYDMINKFLNGLRKNNSEMNLTDLMAKFERLGNRNYFGNWETNYFKDNDKYKNTRQSKL